MISSALRDLSAVNVSQCMPYGRGLFGHRKPMYRNSCHSCNIQQPRSLYMQKLRDFFRNCHMDDNKFEKVTHAYHFSMGKISYK